MPSRRSIMLVGSLATLLVVGLCASFSPSSTPRASPLKPSIQDAPDPDDQDAWQAFGALVHATQEFKDQKPAPVWVGWADKCDAGIASDCTLESPAKTRIVSTDLRSMEYPNQVLARITASLGSGSGAQTRRNVLISQFVQAPQMASVLFDPTASECLLKLNLKSPASLKERICQLDNMKPPATGIAREMPDGTFVTNSTAIKLIWEVVSDAGSAISLQQVRLYNPIKRPVSAGGMNLKSVASWNPVILDTRHPERPCPKTLDPNGTSFPISCFFYYHIGGPDDPYTQQELAELNADGFNVVGGNDPDTDSYVILVGVHMMRLLAGHPNWVWSTYYWTAENNNQPGWEAPWNHFHMMTTSTMRDDSKPLNAPHNVCFSPYLEGTVPPNGLTANCLNCHTFAAYSPEGSKQAAGVTFGEQYKFLPPDIQAAEDSYFKGSVQTAFMWSIANSQDLAAMSQARNALDNEFIKLHSSGRGTRAH